MQQDLRHEKLSTLEERASRLAEQIRGCIEVRIRAMMQRERIEIAEEIEKRKQRGW
jgi:hypothetical protein